MRGDTLGEIAEQIAAATAPDAMLPNDARAAIASCRERIATAAYRVLMLQAACVSPASPRGSSIASLALDRIGTRGDDVTDWLESAESAIDCGEYFELPLIVADCYRIAVECERIADDAGYSVRGILSAGRGL